MIREPFKVGAREAPRGQDASAVPRHTEINDDLFWLGRFARTSIFPAK
mgnify:CR=1 FL=1